MLAYIVRRLVWIAVTLLGVFLTPLSYLAARRWLTRGHLHSGELPQQPPHA